MVKTNCSTLHTVYSIRQSATQSSNDKTHRVSRRTAATTRFSPKKGCQKQTAPSYLPTIRSGGPLPHFAAQMYYGHGVIGDGIFTLWRFGFVLAHGFPLQECWMVMNLFCSRWPSYTNSTHTPWRYTGCANINFLCQGFRKLSPDRQTDRQTRPELYTTPLHGWSKTYTKAAPQKYKILLWQISCRNTLCCWRRHRQVMRFHGVCYRPSIWYELHTATGLCRSVSNRLRCYIHENNKSNTIY